MSHPATQALPLLKKPSAEYARGFEVGQVYALMRHRHATIELLAHPENDEQLLVAAHRFGYEVSMTRQNGRVAMRFTLE